MVWLVNDPAASRPPQADLHRAWIAPAPVVTMVVVGGATVVVVGGTVVVDGAVVEVVGEVVVVGAEVGVVDEAGGEVVETGVVVEFMLGGDVVGGVVEVEGRDDVWVVRAPTATDERSEPFASHAQPAVIPAPARPVRRARNRRRGISGVLIEGTLSAAG